MLEGLLFAFAIITVVALVFTLVIYKNKIDKIKTENFYFEKVNLELEDRYKKLFNQKKSSEVRLGKIGENMAPFLSGWPYDPNDFRFLGNPIDGIQFTDEGIVFVEIKTGKAVLTKSQKDIKRLIKEGKVSFATFRIGEDGCCLREDL